MGTRFVPERCVEDARSTDETTIEEDRAFEDADAAYSRLATSADSLREHHRGSGRHMSYFAALSALSSSDVEEIIDKYLRENPD